MVAADVVAADPAADLAVVTARGITRAFGDTTVLDGVDLRIRRGEVVVTHDVNEALLLADRLLVLEDGRIAEDTPVPLPLPHPRTQDGPAFGALRRHLLARLRVPLLPGRS
ncbi:hypothetical protein ACU635_29820 [[Actinomadura] parvosata]|uniref:hypothetical protein n=1 Tax=[Actinomadura] parvosata TaxID=1955412 RepID=UPI00406C017E